MSFHDRKIFIVSMWHRNITRLTLETITNSRLMNLFSGTWSRTTFYILAFPKFIFCHSYLPSLFFWHYFYENFYKRNVFSIFKIIFNKTYLYVTSFYQFDSSGFYFYFYLFLFFWCFTETESYFTDQNQSSSSCSGNITPIYYVDLDQRVGDGRLLRFAIIVDGIIDAHLSRYVADNRRVT